MGILCYILGHKISRLKGQEKYDLIRAESDTGGIIRIDYCHRCGLLHGKLYPKGHAIVEKIDVLQMEN